MEVPRRSRLILLASIGYIGVVTFWVGPEDSIWVAATLGAIGALLAALNLVTLKLGGRQLRPTQWLLLVTLAGALTGLTASGLTALLMTIKIAVHAHGPDFTDYPVFVVLGILRRAPVWGLAGLLVGAAAGLASLAFSHRRENREAG